MSSELFEAPSLEYLAHHLPQYEFEEFIAQGGMGAVYRARQISLDRLVAIKVLPHVLGENADFRESFSKEAKAMAKVNHPNLIGVFDSGDVDGMPYIVMEYIEGSSLHDACWGHKVETAQAVDIVMGICNGLADAHNHGIIHRDIKPANILLTSKLEPKIGDFGLAHPSDSEEAGLVMGTPGYTAPEIFEDADQAGVLADQYSVGVILHQLITGIDPQGNEDPPSELSGNIRLDAIWRKATQLNPANRYPSVAAMAEDLKKALKSKTAAAAPGRALQVGGPKIIPPRITPVQSSGGGFLVKLIILGVLAAAGWYGYGLYQKNQEALHQPAPTTPQPQTPTTPLPAPRPGTTKPGGSSVTPKPPTPGGSSANTNPRPSPPIPSPHIPTPQPHPTPKPEIPPGDPQLHQKAVGLILDARKKRDALLEKNTSAFKQLLDREAATATSSDSMTYEEIRQACKNGWVPEPDDLPEVNEVISRAHKNAHEEQVSIESKYKTELTRIRDFYVPILEKAANNTSDAELKARLQAQADQAASLNGWVSKLAPDREH